MLADLGLTPETAGKMLHVNPRTVRYWISGKTLIPYSAYRLLRILTGAELPCNGWDGWHMHSGQLWTPEGHGFKPNDSSWWGLLVRQARCFKTLADRETKLRLLAIRAGDVAVPMREDAPAAPASAQPINPPSSNTGGKLPMDFTIRNMGMSWNAGQGDQYPRGIGVVNPDRSEAKRYGRGSN